MMKALVCDAPGGTLRDEVEALQRCVGDLLQHTDPWAFGWTHVVTLVVAALALFGAWLTVRQHHRAGRDDQLWNRIEWSLAQVRESSDDSKMLGLLAIETLLKDNEAMKDFTLSRFDEKLLEDVADTVLADTSPEEGGER